MRTASRPPLERIAHIDREVRAGRYPNARRLGGQLEVDPRTVQRDIEFMRCRLHAPLEFAPRRNGYRYTDPEFRLALTDLTEAELIAVFLAERVLRQYRGLPFAADLARAFAKLTAGLNDRVTVHLDDLATAFSTRTSSDLEVSPETLGVLDSAIRSRRRVRLRYWTASRDAEQDREVDPYHLTSLDAGPWYLIGFCYLRREVRIFATSRIRSAEVLGDRFEVAPGFDVRAYLSEAFGLMRGDGERHRVRLRFTGEAVRYVRERTWHPSQVAEEDGDGGLFVSFELGHLREVERWALSWGADCEVLGPEQLRTRVAASLKDAGRFYDCSVSQRLTASSSRRRGRGPR